MARNGTQVNCLEGSYAHHYTTIAWKQKECLPHVEHMSALGQREGKGLHELVVIARSIYMFSEGFQVPCSDFDPGAAQIPQPMAKSSSCEGNQGSALNFYRPLINIPMSTQC